MDLTVGNLLSGAVGALLAMCFSALAASWKKQREELKNAIVHIEILFTNVTTINSLLVSRYEEVLAQCLPTVSGRKSDILVMQSLNERDLVNIRDLDIEKDNLLFRFSLISVALLEKINRSHRLLKFHLPRYSDNLSHYDKQFVIFSEKERESHLSGFVHIWIQINEYLNLCSLLVSSFEDTLSQKYFSKFSFVKLWHRKSVKYVKGELCSSQETLNLAKQVSEAAANKFNIIEPYRTLFDKLNISVTA